jgi:hypothetical protein
MESNIISEAADHENDLVTLELTKEVAEPVIRKAVEDAGYEFVGIK